MKIGVDLDNTIVCYDNVFYQAAQLQNLLPPHIGKTKGEVRDFFRSIGQEDLWTELQGTVYGSQMSLASPFVGVERFFEKSPHELYIISHRTKFPYRGFPHDLHDSAKKWLQQYPAFQNIPTFFELSLQEKLKRIGEMKCDLFIDDLPELLTESSFPAGVRRLLFDPHHLFPDSSFYEKVNAWQQLYDSLP